MPETAKKARNSYFTPKEISLLLEIIQGYKQIIESKKTDSCSWKEKDECWEKITAELNSRNGETFRSKKSVKTKYEDLKKNLKKKLANNKAEMFKTGGGKPSIQSLTATEDTLESMLDPSQLYGLPSIFDSDVVQGDHENISNNVSDVDAFETIDPSIDECQNWPIEALDFDNNEEYTVSELCVTDNISPSTITESKIRCKRTLPKTTEIVKSLPKKSKGVDVLKTNVSRELRTYPKTSRMENIAGLATAKKELARLQMQLVQQDLKIKGETYVIQKKMLEKELEVKENAVFAEIEMNEAKLKSIQLDVKIKEIELLIKKKQLAKVQE